MLRNSRGVAAIFLVFLGAAGILNNEIPYVSTRWRHPSGWPVDPVVQPVRPVQKCLGGLIYFGFFFLYPGLWPGFSWPRTRAVARDVFSGVFFNGFFRRVFLLPRVVAGWAN
jgi:hypothetical protein